MFLPWWCSQTNPARLKKGMRKRPRRGRVRWCRPLLEILENRLTPAPFVTLGLPHSGYAADAEGGVVSFPVDINQLQDNAGHRGLSSFDLAVTYPTGVFNSSALSASGGVTEGTVLMHGGAWTISATTPADGKLDIQVTAQTPITTDNPPNGGSLVNINFTVALSYNPASATAQAIQVVAANGSFKTGISAPNGIYTLSPAPPYSGSLVINPAVTIVTQSLVNWTVNQAGYDEQFAASGGTGTKTYSQSSGTLPPGMTLSGTGVLSETPTAQGSYTFSVTASDSQGGAGGTNTRAYTVVIDPPLAVAGPTLPPWTAGHAGYFQTTAYGGSGIYIATGLAGGSSPPGVGFGSDFITGTPTTPGTYTFGISYSDNVVATTAFTPVDDPAATMGTYAMGAWTNTPYNGGAVVGFYKDGTGYHGFLYNTWPFTVLGDPTNSYATLDDPSANPGSTYATSIEAQSTIVGYYYDSAGGVHGFTYNGSTYTTLDDPAAAAGTTQVLSIWGKDIVGNYVDSTGLSHGFLYDGSTWTTLDYPGAEAGTTQVTGISGYGIVGSYSDTAGISHGFLYYIGSTWSTLDDANAIPGTTNLKGLADENDFVGTFSDGALHHGFWDGLGGYFLPLDDPAASPGTTVPNSGFFSNIVGYYEDSSGAHGFLATRNGDTIAGTFTVVINPPVSIATTSLPAATEAVPYSQTLTASGGTGSLTFSATGLPAGLTMSSSGVLAGVVDFAGSFPISVTATDSVGATASQIYQLVINPSHFTVSVVGSSTVQAGTSFEVMVQAVDASGNPLSSYGGPGTATSIIVPNSPGSNLPSTLTINTSGVGFFYPNLVQTGTFTIFAETPTMSGSTTVTVTPAAPAKVAFVTQPVNTVTGVSLVPFTVHVLDAFGNVATSDYSDQITVGIASGPGSFTSTSTTTVTVAGGVAVFGNLTLVTPGTYTLSAVVSQLYTGPRSTAFSVAPLEVVPGSFVGTASGFSLQFNAPYLVTSVTPLLYGQGFGATAPPPSVILTTDPGHLSDTAAYVEGSLILNQASSRITFVVTDTVYQQNTGSPVLPDGTYTAIVRSSAATNGFQALDPGGGFLDGLNTGMPGSGDFQAAFVVNAHATHQDVLWAPAAADGPGEALNAPGKNQAGGGYPIYLSDHSGFVTDVQATLTYDPALLTVTPTSTSQFTVTLPSAGMAVLHYTGPAFASGATTPVGFLTATVPSGTASSPISYRAKDLLHLSGVLLNGGGVAATTSDGLHLVAYVGDADGSGSYSSNDAVLITRALLSADSGFTAYPLVDPVIVADTDGSGFIPSDAALQVNEAGVGFPTANLPIPPIPSGVHFQARVYKEPAAPAVADKSALSASSRAVDVFFQRWLRDAGQALESNAAVLAGSDLWDLPLGGSSTTSGKTNKWLLYNLAPRR